MLLLVSYYFYACWNPDLIILIAGTTIITYYCGRAIASEKILHKRVYLWLGTGAPLTALFFFKYFNFFGETANAIFRAVSLPVNIASLNIILPVGISFYTFQALSYVIDVYLGKKTVEKHIGIYALYISFFPQLVAGPIERSGSLLPQFYEEHKFVYEDVVFGLKLMVWGFFKKIVVADTLAIYVDRIYGSVTLYRGFSLIVATIFFAIQIYCDFSGYSDIAIGTARMLGFRLMKNFNVPYLSKSIREFWRRWHISLSSWFMDYIYIPLGGSRVSFPRYALNIMITFLISGLWHGANWTFVIWGALHGFYMLAGKLSMPLRNRLYQSLHINEKGTLAVILKTAGTFTLVSLAWVVFRANSVSDAIYVLKNAFTGIQDPIQYVTAARYELGISKYMAGAICFSLGILFAFDAVSTKRDVFDCICRLRPFPRWLIYYGIIAVILILGQFGVSQFIYFQF